MPIDHPSDEHFPDLAPEVREGVAHGLFFSDALAELGEFRGVTTMTGWTATSLDGELFLGKPAPHEGPAYLRASLDRKGFIEVARGGSVRELLRAPVGPPTETELQTLIGGLGAMVTRKRQSQKFGVEYPGSHADDNLDRYVLEPEMSADELADYGERYAGLLIDAHCLEITETGESGRVEVITAPSEIIYTFPSQAEGQDASVSCNRINAAGHIEGAAAPTLDGLKTAEFSTLPRAHAKAAIRALEAIVQRVRRNAVH